MTTLREAAEMALEALDGVLDTYGEPLYELRIAGGTYEALECRDAITALRAALEQQAKHEETYDSLERYTQEIRAILAGATKRKPLSEGKIGRLCGRFDASHSVAIGIARAIEVAHGIGGEE
jgi:hypothetical protein